MQPLLLALLSQAQPGQAELAMPSARKPVAFLLITPSGKVGNTSSSEIIRVVGELFAKHTDFEVETIDPTSVAECKGQLSCIVRRVRPDYNRAVYLQGDNSVSPYKEHLDYLAKKKIPYPPYLLLLSNLSLGEYDHLSMSLVDTDAALEYFHEAFRDREDWERDTEARINEGAVIGKPIEGDLRSEAETRRFLEDHFGNELRRHFVDTGDWEPFGSIEIASTITGAGVTIDGVVVGTTAAGVTRVVNVPASKHTLAFEHPEFQPHQAEILVERGQVVKLALTLEPKASDLSAGFRAGLLWGGAAIAVAGAVTAGIALGTADSSVKTYCPTIGDEETACGNAQFTRLGGYKPGNAPTFENDVNSGGVLFAPLGYSLAIMGLTWSLGTLFIGDDDDFPWIQLVAGLALGGLSYGLSALLEGDNPYTATP
jgi:hypothetical protein